MYNFKINDFITLKFSYPYTEIYVNGKHFLQCKRLILNIPKDNVEHYNNIESIDEAAEIYDHTVYESQVFKDDGIPDIDNDENFTLISPEEEFWGHCSNLQVWNEHNYDTRLLKANLAFPLLEQLAKVGDKLAQVKFKEEILKRLLSGSESVVEYLFVEEYQDHLSNEELLIGLLEPSEAETLMEIQQKLDITFKFVPSIDRDIEFRPPIISERISKIRKFSSENKYVKGLEFKYTDLVKLPNELFNLKKLNQLRLFGKFSELNSDEVTNLIQKLNGIEEIFLTLRLVKDLDNSTLKKLKGLGIKISPFLGVFPIDPRIL